MIRERITNWKIQTAAAVVLVAFTIGGFIRTDGFTSFLADPADNTFVADGSVSESLPERYPAFDMTRTITNGSGTETWRLTYTDAKTWRITLISSTVDPSRIGDYEELSNGVLTVSERGHVSTTEAGVGYNVPGPWLLHEEWHVRRANASSGVTLTVETCGDDKTLTATKGTSRVEASFDVSTGIPVGYKITEGGVVVESHVVTSLVSQGETIR